MWSTLDHKAVALARLLSQFSDKPRFVALIRGLAAGLQLLEDDLDDLIVLRTLATAEGAALEQYGSIVGEPRGGLTDAEYRRFIQARILINKCRGDLDSLSTIFALLFGVDLIADVDVSRLFQFDTVGHGFDLGRFTALQQIYHREYYPMTTIWTVDHGVAVSAIVAKRIWRCVLDAKAAGVRVDIVEAISPSFRFDTYAHGFDTGLFSRTIRGV